LPTLNQTLKRKMARLAHLVLGVALGVGCRSAESRSAQLGEVPVAASKPISNPQPPACAGSTARPPSSAAKFNIARSKDEATGETNLRLATEACDVEAAVKSEGPELIVARHANCRLGPAEYADVWRQILASAIDESGFVGSKIHLYWGRIASPASDAMAPLMSRRLANAARNDSRWDARRGTVTKGRLNSLVQELARPSQLFPELVRVAGSLGFSVETEYVDKVLVGTVEQLPGDAPSEFGPEEKLPYDAQVGFVLNRMSKSRLHQPGSL
jgi:hypothetical protein